MIHKGLTAEVPDSKVIAALKKLYPILNKLKKILNK